MVFAIFKDWASSEKGLPKESHTEMEYKQKSDFQLKFPQLLGKTLLFLPFFEL